MSEYKNFIQDFPKRCGELLVSFEKRSRFHGREVTLMLSIASAGFTIPYERLRSFHPSGDSARYAEATKKFKALGKQKFLESTLATGAEKTWCRGRLSSHVGGPDVWPEMVSLTALPQNKKTKDVLHHLRNALAHGNIYTLRNPIKTIIFLSETDQGSGIFNYLTVSPDDFCKFLRNWFEFMGGLNLPQEVSAGRIPDEDGVMPEAVNV